MFSVVYNGSSYRFITPSKEFYWSTLTRKIGFWDCPGLNLNLCLGVNKI